jgi:hypothetical protein
MTPVHGVPAMPTLTTADLEQVYDRLAESIDQAPEGRSELMLVKLVLLMARELGDSGRTLALLDTALRDL